MMHNAKTQHLAFFLAPLVSLLVLGCTPENTGIDIGESPAVQQPTQRELSSSVEEFTLPETDITFRMVRVHAGSFMMGSEEQDDLHRVRLTHDFYIATTEVSQDLYRAIMQENPSEFPMNPRHPVERVSYFDAVNFCLALSRKFGCRFSLPTEAQWEYAAKGGHLALQSYTAYSGSSSLSNVGWFISNSPTDTVRTPRPSGDGYEVLVRHATMPTAQKQANQLGLFDMSGNVREWCLDIYGSLSEADSVDPSGATSGAERVYRGGSCSDSAQYCTVSFRQSITPASISFNIGFRVVVNCE